MPLEIVNGKEEVFAVMAPGISKLHQEREVGFQDAAVAARHVQYVPEIPVALAAVPSPPGIKVRIMAAAAAAVRAGAGTGREMPAIRAEWLSASGA